MRAITIGILLTAVVGSGTPATAQEAPPRADEFPPPVRKLLERAVAREGPLPVGQSVALLVLLQPFIPLDPGEIIVPALDCPAPPEFRPISLPPPLFGPDDNDCALIGKTAQVHAYVQQLIAIKETCLAQAVASFQAAQVAAVNLHAQVDALTVTPPSSIFGLAVFGAVDSALGTDSLGEPVIFPAYLQTSWLRTLTRRTEDFCDHAHGVFHPIEDACDEINAAFGEWFTEEQRADFHLRLDNALFDSLGRLLAAQSEVALLTQELEAFLAQFSDDAIICEGSGIFPNLAAHLAARRAYRESLLQRRAFDRERRTRTVKAYLWVDGRLVILTVPASIAARLVDPGR